MKTNPDREFGGTLRKKSRKIARSFDSKLPLHVVLRSLRARGKYSMMKRKFNRKIEVLLHRLSNKYNVKIYEFAGMVALLMYRGRGKFWTSIIYTKMISWGQQFKNVCRYIIQNNLECLGLIPLQDRKFFPRKQKSFIVLDSA